MSARLSLWLAATLVVGLGGLLLLSPLWAAGGAPPERTALDLIGPAQRGVHVGTGVANGAFRWIESVLRGPALAQENEALRGQVERLNTEVTRLRQAAEENEELRALVNYMRSNAQWHYVGAQVIGYDPQRLAQAIVVDKGSRDGVEVGMVVVAEGGLVGRVVSAAATTSQVLLITDPRSAVNGEVQGKRVRGVVRAHGDGRLRLDHPSEGQTVEVGDVVVTSGLGGTFPPGILIGQVAEVKSLSPSDIFPDIIIRSAVAFPRLRWVLFVMDFTPATLP